MAPENTVADKTTSEERIKESLKSSGFLGALSNDALIGKENVLGGFDENISGLIGTKGVQMGSGGLGLRGIGSSGGGGLRSRGLGGGGSAVGIAGGRGGGGKGFGKVAKKPMTKLKLHSMVMTGPPLVERSLIARIIRRRAHALRSCYEREVSKDTKTKAGSLKIEFKISAMGKVAGVRTVHKNNINEAVANCSMSVFKRLLFPSLSGEGVVTIIQELDFNKAKAENAENIPK